MNDSARKVLGWIVATILIVLGISLCFDAYQAFRDNQIPQQESNEAAVDEWITYTNKNYGYEISYPDNVEFVKSSELGRPAAAPGKENQLVFLFSEDDEHFHRLLAGVIIEYEATNLNELEEKYREFTIPSLMRSKVGFAAKATASDFYISTTTLNGMKTLVVNSPISYDFVNFNKEGQVFNVRAQGDFDGSTSTPKDRLTREIMETFKILD